MGQSCQLSHPCVEEKVVCSIMLQRCTQPHAVSSTAQCDDKSSTRQMFQQQPTAVHALCQTAPSSRAATASNKEGASSNQGVRANVPANSRESHTLQAHKVRTGEVFLQILQCCRSVTWKQNSEPFALPCDCVDPVCTCVCGSLCLRACVRACLFKCKQEIYAHHTYLFHIGMRRTT